MKTQASVLSKLTGFNDTLPQAHSLTPRKLCHGLKSHLKGAPGVCMAPAVHSQATPRLNLYWDAAAAALSLRALDRALDVSALSILSSAACSRSKEAAYDMRRQLGAPKASPGTSASCAFSKMYLSEQHRLL